MRGGSTLWAHTNQLNYLSTHIPPAPGYYIGAPMWQTSELRASLKLLLSRVIHVMADVEQLPPAHMRLTPPWIRELLDWAAATFQDRVVDEEVLKDYVGNEVSSAELPVWSMSVCEFAIAGVLPLKGIMVRMLETQDTHSTRIPEKEIPVEYVSLYPHRNDHA